MLYLGWYVTVGIIAIVLFAVYAVGILPRIAEYEFDLWLDLLEQSEDELVGDQTWPLNLLGVAITVVAWPFKLVYFISCWLPEVVKTYKLWYEDEE